MQPMILVEDIAKKFGDLHALQQVSLTVEKGSILGLLGPNGAGKTTLVRILTTLMKPDSGRAVIGGYDVVRDARALRRIIGLAGQYATVDENLNGRENLVMVGQLYHLGYSRAHKRADELLERFSLTDAAMKPTRNYSGGMRRRLDLAASLVAHPQVLFLDEPTTGLDPRSRLGLWEMIKELVAEGTTLLLTTQYLEEADYLADTLALIDDGTIIARGSVDELKEQIGGDVLDLHICDTSRTQEAADAIAELGTGEQQVEQDSGHITLRVAGNRGVLANTVRILDRHEIEIGDIALRRPSLNEVFLSLTGREANEATATKGATNQ